MTSRYLNIRPVVYMSSMRIACIHLPSFPLQVHLRRHPALALPAGAPVVIAGGPAIPGRPGAPTVVACSRAAFARGVRTGMTITAARAIAGDLVVAPRDPAAERATVRALAEALLTIADRVDVGGAPTGAHHALYTEVPSRCRGATYGARAREALAALGLKGRVGIADDRFTAWVAASAGSIDDAEAVSVPRGGSAAFLAPQPLSLLAIQPEVQHMLEAVGVATLGEFAALPPPSVTRSWDADLQALARGDGGIQLAAYAPVGPVVERIATGGGLGVGAVVALAAARLAARLAGREHTAAALAIRVVTPANEPVAIELVPPAPLSGADDLADALALAISGAEIATSVLEVEVEVTAEVSIDGSAAELAPAIPAVDDAVPVAAMAVGSDAFRLEAPIVSAMPREPHRRTRRGKQRPRALPGVQSRLFAALDA
jgi:protein ImuB